MKLKDNTRRRRGKPAPILGILTGFRGKRHRLPANVTGENDWEVEVPQIQMSRAFAVMLVLFIVGVGGLFAFQMFGKEERKQAQTAPAQNPAPAPAVLSAAASTPAVVLSAPPATQPASELPPEFTSLEPPQESAAAPQETDRPYVWKKGDTLQLVANQHSVSVAALIKANPDKAQMPGAEFVIPRTTGRIIEGAPVTAPASSGQGIFDPLADRKIAEVSPPKVEQEAAPELPAVAAAKEKMAEPPAKLVEQPATTKPVSTRTTPREEQKTVTTTKPKAPAAATKVSGQRAHVVDKGDTIYNLARRFGVSADEIAKANGLDSSYRIRVGQQIKIPVRR